MTRSTFALLLCALCAVSLSCRNKPPPTQAFVFNRPERMEYVCVDPEGGAYALKAAKKADKKAGNKPPLLLPLRCCASLAPLAEQAFFKSDDERRRICGENNEPELHALVTQSARGEVAAINLVDRKVLDANRRIPGYTFVDVGGLPRAIVVPREIAGEGRALGPSWTYVASAGEQSVRAFATCSFLLRDGESCGPEARALQKDAATDVPLPAAPADMIEAAGALWVSLPDISAIARIALPAPQSAHWSLPFAGGAQPKLQLFRVPERGELEVAAPEAEDPAYELSCGLGYAVSADRSLDDAVSTALVSGPAQPERLRFDSPTGLIFVGDGGQPAIHMFEPSGSELLDRGVLRTGAPISDFALTGLVPAVTPAVSTLARRNWAPSLNARGRPAAELPSFGPSTTRYVYAIDDRDGSVLAMTLVRADDGTVSSRLVKTQTPFPGMRPDRLALSAVATALDVIDTRALSGPFVCNPSDEEGLDDAIEQAERNVKNTSDVGSVLTEEQRPLAALVELKNRATMAGGGALHGVFLAVADTNGYLSLIDIHDEDLFCRAASSCLRKDPSARKDDDVDPPALMRHALRRLATPEVSVVLNDESVFAPLSSTADPVGCGPGYFAAAYESEPAVSADADGGVSKAAVLVCAARDPWALFNSPFATKYEGAYYPATLPPVERKAGQLEIEAPRGFDFCARGVFGDALDGVGEGYLGDFVVVMSAPAANVPGCQAPEEGREPRFRVVEAFADKLVLAEPQRPTASTSSGQRRLEALTAAETKELLRCYPVGASVELRLNDRYLVQGGGGYLHNLHAGSAGRCVVDPNLDARLTSRAEPGKRFVNPYVEFTLRALEDDNEHERALEATFTLEGGSIPMSSALFATGGEALPVQVRYLDLTGDLYVLDTTSQGLRRFLLSPFASDGSVYR